MLLTVVSYTQEDKGTNVSAVIWSRNRRVKIIHQTLQNYNHRQLCNNGVLDLRDGFSESKSEKKGLGLQTITFGQSLKQRSSPGLEGNVGSKTKIFLQLKMLQHDNRSQAQWFLPILHSGEVEAGGRGGGQSQPHETYKNETRWKKTQEGSIVTE